MLNYLTIYTHYSLQTSVANQTSDQSESFYLTPAKRIRAVNTELDDLAQDESSVTRNAGSVNIKKEKFAKSG